MPLSRTVAPRRTGAPARRTGLIAALSLLLILAVSGPAMAGWRTQKHATYDGCEYRFEYGTWWAAYPAAKTTDENGGCQYQYVKGWDSDELHIHGFTSSNPASIAFNDHDEPKTVLWKVKTWEHGWYSQLQKTFN